MWYGTVNCVHEKKKKREKKNVTAAISAISILDDVTPDPLIKKSDNKYWVPTDARELFMKCERVGKKLTSFLLKW